MTKVKLGSKVPAIPAPLYLLGSIVNGKSTFCTIAWSTIIDDEPPMIGLVTAKKRYTNEGILHNKTFSINIPDVSLAKETDYCGMHSGHDVDKSEVFKTFSGDIENAPMIEGCPVTAECRLKEIINFEGTDMIVGEIINLYVNDELLDGKYVNAVKMNPLIYFTSGSVYYSLGKEIGKAFKIGNEYTPHE